MRSTRPITQNEKTAAHGQENRKFVRVECIMGVEFLVSSHDDWIRADVLDLSVAGMKVRFNPFQRGRTLRPELFEWMGGQFRFPSRRSFFQLNGHFLKVYLREAGLFTAGVEFDDPSPEDQFRLVELYAEFRRRGG